MRLQQNRLAASIFIVALICVLVTPAFSQTPTLKPEVRGIMDRNGRVPGDLDPNFNFIDYVVVNVPWNMLECHTSSGVGSFYQTDGSDMLGWQQIDTVIRNPKVVGVRLRITAGIDAPDFVKQLGHTPVSAFGHDCSIKPDGSGGGIALRQPQTGDVQCTSFFWTSDAIEQYRQLMAEVARRYDSNTGNAAKVRDVVNSGCTTVYSESFFRAHDDSESNHLLSSAGLNTYSDHNCQDRTMSIHDNLFVRTRTMIAVDPWDIITNVAPDYRTVSWADTRDFVNKWRGIMGKKLMVMNTGLGESDGCPNWNGMIVDDPNGPKFCYLKNAAVDGQPMGFQTETFVKLGVVGSPTTPPPYDDSLRGLYHAIQSALAMQASFVEIPTLPTDPGDSNAYTTLRQRYPDAVQKLQNYDNQLQANVGP